MCFTGIDEEYHEALLVVNFCKEISVFTNGSMYLKDKTHVY